MKQHQFYCKLDSINMANKVAVDIIESVKAFGTDADPRIAEQLGSTLANVQKAQMLFSRCASELLSILDVDINDIEENEKD